MAVKAMQILIAMDRSSGSEVSLKDLKRAGLPPRVELLVLSVADVILPTRGQTNEQQAPKWVVDEIEKARVRGLEAIEQARAAALRLQGSAQTTFPRWTVHAEAIADSPAWGIVKKAEEWKADLIVVGSHDRSALGRLMLGSVSQSVLHHAATSVRIARSPGNLENTPICLVAGEDGSEDAEAALSALAGRNWPDGTTVHLVTAVDQVLALMALGSSVGAQAGDWIERLNERAVAKLRAAGLVVSTLVADGDPRRILVDEAERLKADSIFIGARGLRGIERLVLGRVSTAVATRAHCSVEVVRFAPTAFSTQKPEGRWLNLAFWRTAWALSG
jgi:nucleotide-binding universal stress UspA family protein